MAWQKWDKDLMAMAILAIREKKMGFLKASTTFDVPKSTLILVIIRPECSEHVQ